MIAEILVKQKKSGPQWKTEDIFHSTGTMLGQYWAFPIPA
jgi:hypothetical protein